MAEERIGIKIEIYDPCGRCTIKDKCAKNKDQQAFLIDPNSCFQYKLLHRLPTKAEVIERMAKAMFEWQRPGSRGDVPIEDVWQNEKCGFENLAEAALNALLEDK